jgi:ribosomal protein S12 methylthiotransferase accessory factor YcaO
MHFDIGRDMPKVVWESERALDLDTTIARAEAGLQRAGVKFEIVPRSCNDLLWIADVSWQAPPEAGFLINFRVGGKGPTKKQALASGLMELVERLSLYYYYGKKLKEATCVDLADGTRLTAELRNELANTKCVASGNNYEEAILHCLHELIETRLGRSYFWRPLAVIDTRACLPDYPQWIHDTITLVQNPSAHPQFYHITAVNYPVDGQFDLEIGPKYIKAGDRLFAQPRFRPKNHHSPHTGGAAGLDPKMTAIRAINEVFMGHSTPTSGTDKKRPLPKCIQRVRPDTLRDHSTPSVTGDIRKILSLLGPDTFVGAIDLAHPKIDLPVVKVLSDWDPHTSLTSRKTLQLFYHLSTRSAD